MSSILKALKKLENEQPSVGKKRPWLREIQEKEPVAERLLDRWIAHQRLFVVCTAALLGLAGIVAIIQKTGIIDKPVITVKSEKQRVAAGIDTQPSNYAVQAKTAAPVTAAPLPAVRALLPKEAGMKAQKVMPKSASLTPPGTEHAVVPEPQPEPEASLVQTSKAIPGVSSHPDLQTASETEGDGIVKNFASVKPVQILNDELIKLQAVSWSRDPEKRIAVINNRIVRRGDRIESYVVIKINKDDVVLEQNREMWKIQFRPR